VPAVTVDLDRQVNIRISEVDASDQSAVVTDLMLASGKRQTSASKEPEKSGLEWTLRHSASDPRLKKLGEAAGSPSAARPQSVETPSQAIDARESTAQGLVERLFEDICPDQSGEVDKGSSRCGNRNMVDVGAVQRQ